MGENGEVPASSPAVPFDFIVTVGDFGLVSLFDA